MCFQINCENGTDLSLIRSGKTISEDLLQDGEILDRLEVFNSVEVLAPEIDDMNQSNQIDMSGKWKISRIDATIFVNTRTFLHFDCVMYKFVYLFVYKVYGCTISFLFIACTYSPSPYIAAYVHLLELLFSFIVE